MKNKMLSFLKNLFTVNQITDWDTAIRTFEWEVAKYGIEAAVKRSKRSGGWTFLPDAMKKDIANGSYQIQYP
jgi:hypothetical protein